MVEQFTPYDPAQSLDSPQAIAVFITDAFDSGDANYIASCLGVVARAKGMTGLAKDTGLSREQLYSSLSGTGNPTLNTLLAVMSSLNLKIQTVAVSDTK